MAGNRQHIIHGLRDGIPIAMGYFAVTFSLGIIAARAGLTAPLGFLSSFFTRASAGEYGTYTLLAVQAAYVEVIAMCLVANLRYMLMSAALSQKMLSQTLKNLEQSHLVHREVYPEVPPRVEYSLTETGKSLMPAIIALIEWGQAHFKEVVTD